MSKTSDAHFLIAKLFSQPTAEQVWQSHPWPHEEDRWQELVFCLLSRCLTRPEVEVRQLTGLLRFLNLLKVSDWDDSEAADDSDNNRVAERAFEVLTENGINAADAKRCVEVIGQAAMSLSDAYDGKVQQALRTIGETAQDLLMRTLDISSLDDAARKEALSCWLQNVANLPLSLERNSMATFCATYKVSPQDLLRAADDMDVNTALLDDLLHHWLMSKTNKDVQKGS